MPSSFPSGLLSRLFSLGVVLAAPTPVLAQHHDHAAAESKASADASVSARTREQIRAVERALQPLATPDAAREAGFEPVFGWVPSMGTHWVSIPRMEDGFDLMKPDHLMFSPVKGELRLVGAAYAFVGAKRARLPQGFAGTLDRWHDHDWLAPEGETIHMLHVWFVDSPDGPFAGHNPWLPFWALDLEPPDESRMKDPAVARRVRALASALASTVEPGSTDQILQRYAGAVAVQNVERRRAVIRAIVPKLREAQRRGDTAEWDRLAERGADEWRAIRAIYLDSARTPRQRTLIAMVLDQVMGREDGAHH